MSDRIEYACGCSNEPQPPSGVLKNVVRCPEHQGERRDPATLDESYYAEFGLVRDGKPVATRHVAELVEALGPIPKAPKGGIALEVGCGTSPYVAPITLAEYRYIGVDPSQWAADWVQRFHGVPVRCGRVEELPMGWPIFDLILAAHVIEHIGDAPKVIAGLAGMLTPGGELWVIVPDDEDPVNPDHEVYFDEGSLRYCLVAAGLEVVTLVVRRHVERENFLYARARKPCS